MTATDTELARDGDRLVGRGGPPRGRERDPRRGEQLARLKVTGLDDGLRLGLDGRNGVPRPLLDLDELCEGTHRGLDVAVGRDAVAPERGHRLRAPVHRLRDERAPARACRRAIASATATSAATNSGFMSP